jgi:homoserine kinase
MSAPPVLRACAVRVPCSTSNLGAGFDCIGLAFDRYLDAGYEPGGDALRISRTGTLADLDASADDVLVRAFTSALRRHGVARPAGSLMVGSAIPVGYGLGSSGAAAVAGGALAAAATGTALDRDGALAAAIRLEGHPDNAAPALFGGLTAVAVTEQGVPRAMRLPLARGIGWSFAAPDAIVSTQRARAALPQHVPHSAATRTTGRMAALLFGLANADAEALATGFGDELHVPYRLPLIPGAREAMGAALAAGAWAVTISGSGSGLLAACPPGREHPVVDAMCGSFRQGGHGGGGFILRPDLHGVQPRDITTLRAALRAASRD